jgi:hypothetical protein
MRKRGKRGGMSGLLPAAVPDACATQHGGFATSLSLNGVTGDRIDAFDQRLQGGFGGGEFHGDPKGVWVGTIVRGFAAAAQP